MLGQLHARRTTEHLYHTLFCYCLLSLHILSRSPTAVTAVLVRTAAAVLL